MFQQFKKRSLAYRAWYYLERRAKELLFDCHMCGQCVVRSTSLTCPMTCPKQLRNGPCGGSMDGMCEVFPDKRCIWTDVYERADRFAFLKTKLRNIQPAIDWRLFGSSAWLNIWPEHKIDVSGHAFSPAPTPCGTRWEKLNGAAGAATASAAGCGSGGCGCGAGKAAPAAGTAAGPVAAGNGRH